MKKRGAKPSVIIKATQEEAVLFELIRNGLKGKSVNEKYFISKYDWITDNKGKGCPVVRSKINILRKQSAPIITTNTGYYFTNSPVKIMNWVMKNK